ncbi:MAG TPA: YbhB/YbcL family Raf kinase inhibitor-like protein, partial [Nitrospira sp.]|nr:YbhB/YbcL family Raf kinase inhibitor-like protein [Nitrospira sp.]
MRRLMASMICALLVGPAVGRAAEFQVTSPTIKDQSTIGNEHVFNGFGCTGGNLSPELRWDHAPKDTKSFAVTVYDPDAPTGSGWWHWLIFNIAPSVTHLPAGAGQPESAGAPQGS